MVLIGCRLLKKVVPILVLILLSISGFSQLATEHFIPPVYPSTHSWTYPREQSVYISTPSVTPVSYTIKNGAGVVLSSGMVSNAAPIEFRMSAFNTVAGEPAPFVVQDAQLNTVIPNRGLHIQADEEVYVNLRANGGGGTRPNATSLTSKGSAALGREFRVGHFINPQNYDCNNSFGSKSSTVGIMATEDNTSISIDLTGHDLVLQGSPNVNANGVINITLNAGETYVMAIKNQTAPTKNPGRGMIGAGITSDKDIVVNSGSWGGNRLNCHGTNNPYGVVDIGIDQIAPFKNVGKEYAVVRGASNNNAHERVVVVAHVDGTQVTVNGTPVGAPLMAGEYREISGALFVNRAMYIQTSEPAFVYQFIMGANNWENKTQGMNFIPPISCRTASYVDNIPIIQQIGGRNYGGALSVVTLKGSTVLVNGAPVGSAPTAVPGSIYEYYKVGGLTGNVKVESNTIALVSIVGQNAAAGYGGFFSGFDEVEIDAVSNCAPDFIYATSDRVFQDYEWFHNGSILPSETNDTLFSTVPGDYRFKYTLGFAPNTCNDTSGTLTVYPVPDIQVANASVCDPATVDLTGQILGTSTDLGINKYYTDAAATMEYADSLNAIVGAYYVVSRDTVNGCADTTSMQVSESPTPRVTSDTIFSVCSGSQKSVLELGTSNNANEYSIDWDAIAEAQGLVDVAPTPLPLGDALGYLFQGSPTKMFSMNLITGDTTLIHTFGEYFNAWTYNEIDGYYWATSVMVRASGFREVVRFDPSDWSEVGATAGNFVRPQTGGTFDPVNGYYVTTTNVSTGVNFVDVYDANPNSPTYGDYLFGFNGTSKFVADIAFVTEDSLVYGVGEDASLVQIDAVNQTNTILGVVSGIPSGSHYGAAYADGDGKMYVASNTTGNIYLIDFAVDPLTATLFSSGPPSGNNDGAKALSGKSHEIDITNINAATGGNYNGTISVFNTVSGCSSSSPINLTINATPALVNTNPAIVCMPNTVDITQALLYAGSSDTLSTGWTYWTDADALVPITDASVTDTSGTYYVVNENNGCFDTTAIDVVIENCYVDLDQDNDGIVDTLEGFCSDTISGGVNSTIAGWQFIGPVSGGHSYDFRTFASDIRDFTATNGPQTGDRVLAVIYNTLTSPQRSVGLERHRYYGLTYNSTLSHYDNTPHNWTDLTHGVAMEGAPVLGFMAFVDLNGNGDYDSGIDDYFRDLTSLEIAPATDGDLYMAFYDDGNYTDNSGTISVEATCVSTDFDKDGIPDYLDLDSDNDGCLDAIEGGGSFSITDVKIDSSLTGVEDVNGIPVIAAGGQGLGSSVDSTVSTCCGDLVLSDPVPVCFPNTVDITDKSLYLGSSDTIAGAWEYWTDAGATVPVLDPAAISASGKYYVTNTSPYCVLLDSVTVTINPTPSLSITDPTPVCEPNTIDLEAPGITTGSTLNGGTLSYYDSTMAVYNQPATADSGLYYIVASTGLCHDTATVNVVVNPKPVLQITDPIPVCAPNTIDITVASVTAISTLHGGTLNYFDDGMITYATPAVADSGLYYIETVSDSLCRDTAAVNVVVNPKPVLQITDPTPVCAPNTIDITVASVTATSTLYGGTLNYFDDGMITYATPSATDSGLYYIETISDDMCRDTAAVNVVVNLKPVLQITDPTPVCAPNTIDITAASVTATSTLYGGTLNYFDDGMITYATPSTADSGLYYVETVSDDMCRDTAAVNVVVNPKPVLSITDPAEVCAPNKVDITEAGVTSNSTLYGSSLSYYTNSVATALYNTTSVADSGAYYVVAMSASSCSDTALINAVVNPNPVVELGNDTTICVGTTLTINPNTVGLNLAWSGGLSTPTITVSSAGLYTVTVTDPTTTCTASDSKRVLISDPSSSINTNITDPCFGDALIPLTTSPAGGVLSGNGLQADQFNPSDGTLTLELENWIVYTVTDVHNCIAKDSVAIRLHEVPVASQVILSETICEGEVAILNVLETGSTQLQWYKRPVSSVLAIGSSLTVNESGVYYVRASTPWCESYSDNAIVNVLVPSVVANVDADRIKFGNSTNVSVVGADPLMSYNWSTDPVGTIGDGLSNTSFQSYPLESTTYTVEASFISDPGCIATDEVTVIVTKPPLPDQVFSPGNEDGVNDYWRIVNLNTEAYPQNVVRVFNRWGNIVYEGFGYDYDGTGDPEDSSTKWDGTRNGKLVPLAVYYYVIELNDPDATVLGGAITIIR